MLLALIPIMFTYSGWNAGAYVAEEVRDPERNVPLALGLGTLAIIVIYLSLNALYLYALPVPELAAIEGARLSDTVAERLFGFGAGNLLAAFSIVSLAASISAMIAGPRVYFAMARDGVFAAPAGEIHPKFRAPVHAVIAQAIWSGVLVLSGTLSQLVNYAGFAVVLFSAVAVGAVFILRRRQPHEVRPFRAWGYPWAPATFMIASAAMLGSILWNTPWASSIWGFAVIAAGLPIYWWMRRNARPR
jgi:APA family basic amino acid/polyamine antiporter